MERAFEILVAEYRPMVLSYLRALVHDGHLAEDLTQETMLIAHRKIDSFDSERNCVAESLGERLSANWFSGPLSQHPAQ